MGSISHGIFRLGAAWIVLLACLLAEANGQWIEKPRHGWLQLSVYHHDTRERFDPQGRIEPLFNEDGRSITTSAFLTGVMGVMRGVDVWAQLPVHRLAFNDVAAKRESFGLGDPLLHVRMGPDLFGLPSAVPVAVRAGVKLPLGEFPIDSEIVPLTEGQRDWEVLLELGHSFYPLPVYVMGWVGYRWRETNVDIERKPGDEQFAFMAVGGSYHRLRWKFSVEGILGKRWESLTAVRIPLAMSERKLLQLTPSMGWMLGPGSIEVGGRLPVMGQNLPAGPALFLGYFVRMGRP